MSADDDLRALLDELLGEIAAGGAAAWLLVKAAGEGRDVLRAAALGLSEDRARVAAAILADLLVRRTRGQIRHVPNDATVLSLVAAAESQVLAALDVARDLPGAVAKRAAANLAASYRDQRSRALAGAVGLN